MNEDEKISHPTIEIIQKAIFGVDKKAKKAKTMSYTAGTEARTSFRNKDMLSVSNTGYNGNMPYHSEMMYRNEFPRIIAFLCLRPSTSGGQTPLANCIDIYHNLDSTLKIKWKNTGLNTYKTCLGKIWNTILIKKLGKILSRQLIKKRSPMYVKNGMVKTVGM
eukprot:UN31263